MRVLSHTTLVAATVSVGLVAGLLGAFAVAIMPALRGATDRTFVETMQRINVSILNPIFLSAFMGGLLLSAAAVVLHWVDDDRRDAVPWIVAGLVLYVVVVAITSRVNVPLNEQLDAAGDPDRIADLGAVRRHFEDRWVTWNIVRSVVNVAAFCCLSIGLLVAGRADATADETTSAPAPSVLVAS